MMEGSEQGSRSSTILHNEDLVLFDLTIFLLYDKPTLSVEALSDRRDFFMVLRTDGGSAVFFWVPVVQELRTIVVFGTQF